MKGIILSSAFYFHRLVEEKTWKPLLQQEKCLTTPFLPIQYPAPSFITRVSSLPVFFHLGRFFHSFSQLFSFVPAPSYHPALTSSPRLRNILSSVVPRVYYFISDTFTLSKTRREKTEIISCIFFSFSLYSKSHILE